jgi:hypothetical protein|tara:strand:- start:140385 stop:140594 length:210 start_codon:yes stop_codon:yes gene_type:complete
LVGFFYGLFTCTQAALFFVIPPHIAIRFPATAIFPTIDFAGFKANILTPIGAFPALHFASIFSNISTFI